MKLLSNIKQLVKGFSFGTKMAPVRGIIGIALFSFLTNIFPRKFISSSTTICFRTKKIIECLYFSEYNIHQNIAVLYNVLFP